MSEARMTIREKLIQDGLLAFYYQLDCKAQLDLLKHRANIDKIIRLWAESQPEEGCCDCAELAKRVEELDVRLDKESSHLEGFTLQMVDLWKRVISMESYLARPNIKPYDI